MIFVHFEKKEKKDMTTCEEHFGYKEMNDVYSQSKSSYLIPVNRIIYGLVM